MSVKLTGLPPAARNGNRAAVVPIAEPSQSQTMPTHRGMLQRLWNYVKPYRTRFFAGILCGLILSLLQPATFLALKSFVDGMEKKNQAGLAQSQVACLVFVGIYVFSWIFRYLQSILLADVAQRVGLRIRSEVYTHLQHLPLAYFHKKRTGGLMTVLTNDVPKLQDTAMLARSIVATPFELVVLLITAFFISWKLTLASLLIVPVMGFVIGRLTRQIRAVSRSSQDQTGEINAIMDETLSAPRIVKAFSAEDREIARFLDANRRLFTIVMGNIQRTSRLTPTVDLLGAVAVAGALWFGAHEAAQGRLSVSELVAFIAAASKLNGTVGSLGGLRSAWEEMMGAADRIFGEVLTQPTEIRNAPNARILPPMEGRIRFENVWFRYHADDKEIRATLAEIDLEIEPGQMVALVGETGAGKSTLADLIPRFYDPTDGRITVDGHDLRDVTIESLRRQIAIVPQETLLFSGSLRDNIAYGRPDATDDEIIAAARAANADRFIQQLPQKYETRVGERGATLSGGERQRIAIARALLTNPRLLILDEATSALDAQTESLVQEALDRLMRNRTTIVIAHRLSTIIGADKIVVLQRGQIAESGTHGSLMRQNGIYAALYQTQQRALELHFEVDDLGMESVRRRGSSAAETVGAAA